MFKSYFKTAVRSLLKNKGFTAINVMGLTLGIATCLLIVFYVLDELSYDRYNLNADRIYRVNNEIKFGGLDKVFAGSQAPAAFALKREFPEIEQVARIQNNGRIRVKKGTQYIQENYSGYADSTLFGVFTLPMIEGDAAVALREPNSVVITEKTALKYFSRTNVVGQVLLVDDDHPYKITGVIRDIPTESHFRFDFIFSMATDTSSREGTWLSNNFVTYLLLKPGVDPRELQAKMPGFLREHMGPQLVSALHVTMDKFEQAGNYYRYSLFPLLKIHLYSNSIDDLAPNGNIEYIYIFSAIALVILLIACINFMNLSTARSANRAREVGVRKVLGSRRKYLVLQFLTESVLVTLAGAALAVLLAWMLLPLFNLLSGKELVLSLPLLRMLLPVLLVVVVVIGCLAGCYPAFYLSAFQPVAVLKGSKGSAAGGLKSGWLRSTLVVFQFAISFFLIASTLVVYQQIRYIQSRDLGYDRSHVLIIQNTYALGSQARAFKQEVRQLAGVDDATLSAALPTNQYGNWTSFFEDRGLDQRQALHSQLWDVDEDYLGTLGIQIRSGRNFSSQMGTDSDAIVVNESLAKSLSFKDPLNQHLYAPLDNLLKNIATYHIIGVVKDFNFRSLRDNVTPLAFRLRSDPGALSVRVHSGADVPEVLAQVRDKWRSFIPNQEFTYSFMEQDFEGLYRTEERIGRLFVSFSSLAILIACLGLFGLATYAAEQRTKEIGIRKVLGAGVSTIVGMLSREFIRLVLLSVVIATPVAWLAMRKWLEGFAYQIKISVWIFVAAGMIALVIALLTVSVQTLRAASANPIKSLKAE